jgi:hypothetical protein
MGTPRCRRLDHDPDNKGRACKTSGYHQLKTTVVYRATSRIRSPTVYTGFNDAPVRVPNALIVELNKGEAPLETVLQDILTLTKLNYNTCIFGDGLPITLKFANAVGEMLTAGPIKDIPPLPFSHYI